MVKDRLATLVQFEEESDDFPDLLSCDDRNEHIVALLKQVEDVQRHIDNIAKNVAKLKDKHKKIIAEPSYDSAMKEEVTQLIGVIKEEASSVRSTLQLMKREYESNSDETGKDSAEYRIMETQWNLLTKNFLDVKSEYNECQVKYRQKWKERIQRQLAIAGRTTTDEQMEEMIESGNPRIITQGIVMETKTAKRALADVEAREEDIMKLEQSVLDLHDMFMDMAMLVEQQGEMIDIIEKNVQKATEWVGEGAGEIIHAEKVHKDIRKRKIWIGVLLTVVIVVIIAIIVSSVVFR